MAVISGLFRIGNDPAIRHTPNGDAVVNLSLAFNYGKKGDDGKRPSQWVEASLWGKRAEALVQYLQKGGQVDVIVGEPHIETYEHNGKTGAKLVGRVLEIELAGGRSDSAEKPAPAPKPAAAPASSGGGSFDDMADDIPF